MSYQSHTAEDLASDPRFRAWVLRKDSADNHFWSKWIRENPHKHQIVLEARSIVLALGEGTLSPTESDLANLWGRIDNSLAKPASKVVAINKPGKQEAPKKTHQARKRPFKRLLGIAAALGTVMVAYWLQGVKPGETSTVVVAQPEFVEREVMAGQKLKLFLPDGSEVSINSESRIRFPKEFDADRREVELIGEAFFEVAEDSLRPFVVSAGTLQTEVLGTSFNVRAYPSETNASVSLVEGKVKVSTDTQPLLLVPGEEVRLNVQSGKLVKGPIRDRESLEWRNGVLSIKDMPLPQVFRKLEQWYGVTIHTNEVPKGTRVTGTFDNEYLTNVLESIQYTIGFKFTIKGDSVYVDF